MPVTRSPASRIDPVTSILWRSRFAWIFIANQVMSSEVAANGTEIANAQRHPAVSVMRPPSSGPPNWAETVTAAS